MGFFKNIFKKKPGGTFLGNLIRKGANVASGGVLGNGTELRAWEAKQEVSQQNQLLQKQQLANDLGTAIGNQAKPLMAKIENSKEVQSAKNTMAMEYLKKNWWKLLIPVALVVGLTYYVAKRGNKRTPKRY